MKLYTVDKVLRLVFGEDFSETDVYVTIEYYKTTYGEDADGNSGIPALELKSYKIEIPNTCLENKKITDKERDELYKDAFAELMADWECWTYED